MPVMFNLTFNMCSYPVSLGNNLPTLVGVWLRTSRPPRPCSRGIYWVDVVVVVVSFLIVNIIKEANMMKYIVVVLLIFPCYPYIIYVHILMQTLPKRNHLKRKEKSTKIYEHILFMFSETKKKRNTN